MPTPGYVIMPSGILFNLFDPEPDDFRINDIAHKLAAEPRFGGACDPWYSVAQHSVYASFMVSPPKAKAALLHDGTEAYIRDLVRPFKVTLPGYCEFEQNLGAKLALSFGLAVNAFEDDEIKLVDDKLMALEATVMIRNPQAVWAWTGGAAPDGSIFDIDPEFKPWPPADAKQMFLQRFDQIRLEIG
jgi:uncharacterized protein